MTRIPVSEGKQPEVAEILRKHIMDYQQRYPLLPEHRKIVNDLLNCRTPYLGGHVDRCDHCGSTRIVYHSCRNRHCPKCQHVPRERWLAKRNSEMLDCGYFHVVFTLPHDLNTVVLNNKKVMFNILFAAASRTLLSFGENDIGGKMGFIAVLHTWDQKLQSHFHLHCLVAGGAVSKNGTRWIPCKNDYLFNETALSLVFRGKFIEGMGKACQQGKLVFAQGGYNKLKARLYDKNWIIDVRDPVKQPNHVLQYLARYTHRVAIANSRITAFANGNVTFKAKDRKKNRTVPVTIPAVEFIRRFLLHSLPRQFVRIRHYGFLSNRNRSENLNAIRQLMGLPEIVDKPIASVDDVMLGLTGVDITVCPYCKKGRMQLVFEIPRGLVRPPNPLALKAA